MSTIRIDMPTNEGTLAIARSVATGAKLVIRGVMLCKTEGAVSTVEEAASVTWGESDNGIDLSEYAAKSESGMDVPIIPCTSYLPSMVDMQGVDTGNPITALDIEFTWLPSEKVEYDTLAVLADMYYEFAPFYNGGDYRVGDTVWYLLNTGEYEYYRCIMNVNNSGNPANDDEHWESVQPGEPNESIGSSRNIQYRAIGDRPILLYVSVASNVITVSPELEIDYKVRLYLDGITEVDEISKHIVFDTLGPEFMGSAQLALLAQFATQLRYIRDVAVQNVSNG